MATAIEKWMSIKPILLTNIFFFDRKNMLFATGFGKLFCGSNNSPGLPWKYDLVRKKATASLNMDSRSNFDKIFCSNGRSEAKWSSSPFNRSRWRLEGLLLAWLLLSFVGVGLRLKRWKMVSIRTCALHIWSRSRKPSLKNKWAITTRIDHSGWKFQEKVSFFKWDFCQHL